ncbi:methylmalonyl-CoA mutase family protein [bacterium]|nr:methylmalonyl-CoA mutase family protein [bacterium]
MALFSSILERYKSIVEKATSKFPERKKQFSNSSKTELNPFYYSDNEEDANKLSAPGIYPFTRGIQPTMYRSRFWTMRQYAGFSTAQESNKRYKYLLENGTTGLSVAFDLPTQMGYDSDSDYSIGEVGKVGVAIDTLEDMETLFEGIPLDKVSTSMTINATASVLLGMYIAVAKKQGISLDKISGTIQNDILKEYMARGTYIYPVEPSLRIITDIFEFCSKEVPKWNTISISGYHIREAGSTAAQELAFTLADGIAYVKAAVECGLDVDSFAQRLSFFFNAHNNFFEEIAKFRAARRMWAKIMKERFGAKKESSMMFRVHTQTAGSTLTAQQVDNNIVRVTIQALAAVLGGTQSLHTNSRDEALALPTEDSVQIALRTQQIIAYESGVADVVDPLGGSYYIESLTDKLESDAWEYINKIDQAGGMINAINEGYPQKEIQDASYSFQQAVDRGEEIIVGVNKFQSEENKRCGQLLRIDDSVRDSQIEKLKSLKNRRDSKKVEETLKLLKEAALGTENLMPKIIDAVEAYATLGEISNVMRDVFGEYQEKIIL